MLKKTSYPIGVFDSGIGGLTLLQKLKEYLPTENFIYFGDTAHLPYGDKSQQAICRYALKICHFLVSQGCKLILIACNSASAAAFDYLSHTIDQNVLLMNVIDPVVNVLTQNYLSRVIGLIGTKQTVDSHSYQDKIAAKVGDKLCLHAIATPLLAPMIEKGFYSGRVASDIIADYLTAFKGKNIDSLVLACTHYPLIKKEINDFFNGSIEIIDTLDIVANDVRETLIAQNLLNREGEGQVKIFLSDYTDSFAQSAKRFFGEESLLLTEIQL